jgi:hypothetical protein
MLSSLFQYALLFDLLATKIPNVRGIMVESVDGSFVPWSFVARAPGDGTVAVRMKNNHDLSYLVSSHRFSYVISADQVIGDCPDGLVFIAHIVSRLLQSQFHEPGTPPQQIQMAVSLSQNHISVATAPQGVGDVSLCV